MESRGASGTSLGLDGFDDDLSPRDQGRPVKLVFLDMLVIVLEQVRQLDLGLVLASSCTDNWSARNDLPEGLLHLGERPALIEPVFP